MNICNHITAFHYWFLIIILKTLGSVRVFTVITSYTDSFELIAQVAILISGMTYLIYFLVIQCMKTGGLYKATKDGKYK